MGAPINISQTTDGLPLLLEKQALPARGWIARYLNYLGRWREHLYWRWCDTQRRAAGNSEILDAVDQLIAVALLSHFIGQRDTGAAPLLEEAFASVNRPSVGALCRAARAAISCPLLHEFFDPSQFNSELPIPPAILQAGLMERIPKATTGVFGSPMPASIFGEFHQLCLAYPLDQKAMGRSARRQPSSRRYDRGVHYTPAPLVDYLVYRSLSQAFKGLEPDRIRSLRILDPSCGCGAFLIAAFRYTIMWLRGQQGPRSAVKVSRADHATDALSLQDCLDLTETMFFGADIDERAVQWTIRLLLLTAWESCPNSLSESAALRIPNLRRKIVCADFLDPVVTDHEGKSAAFNAGVDVVIGGPPFVRIQQLYKTQPERIAKYKRQFMTCQSGQFDLYMLFIERALEHLVRGGRLGFSLSNTFLRTASGHIVRNLIAKTCSINEIVEFEDPNIYPDAITQIALISLGKRKPPEACRHVWIKGKSRLREKLAAICAENASDIPSVEIRILPADALKSANWVFDSPDEKELLQRIQSAGKKLKHFPIAIHRGITTGADKVFLLKLISQYGPNGVLVEHRDSGRRFWLESAAVRPIVRGRDIQGYGRPKLRTVCVFPYAQNGHILDEDTLRNDFPLVYRYLAAHRTEIASRKLSRRSPWYSLASRYPAHILRAPKLIASVIDTGCGFALDLEDHFFCNSSVISLTPQRNSINPHLLLAIVNSRVFWTYVGRRSPTMGKGRYVYRNAVLRNFSLALPKSDQESCRYRELSDLAKRMLDSDMEHAQRQQARSAIDEIVADLYGIRDVLDDCSRIYPT